MRVAVVYLAEAAPAPGEVHLGNQHPVVVWSNGHHLREVSRRARSLHEAREIDRRARNRDAAASVLAAIEKVRLIAVQFVDPPVAVAKGAVDRRVLARVNGVDGPITAWRSRP